MAKNPKESASQKGGQEKKPLPKKSASPENISLTLEGHSVESEPSSKLEALEEDHKVERNPLIDKSVALFIFINGVFLVGLIFLGFIYYRSGKSSLTEPKETSIEIEQPATTPELNLSQYNIRILNGSGTPGEAKKVADILKTKGFTNIDTGDADTYDFQETEVSLKDDVPSELFEILKSTLPTFSLKKTESLKDSSYDVLIIVGSSKEE